MPFLKVPHYTLELSQQENMVEYFGSDIFLKTSAGNGFHLFPAS